MLIYIYSLHSASASNTLTLWIGGAALLFHRNPNVKWFRIVVVVERVKTTLEII